MARLLFALGSIPFIALGLTHLVLTLRDVIRPRFFTPRNERVRGLMVETPLRLTGQMTMWRAWLGFNLSHGVGVVFFGVVCLLAALADFGGRVVATGLMPLAAVVGWIYVVLAWRYWYRIPLVGTAIGAACLTASALLVLVG